VRSLDPIEAGHATALRLHDQVDVLVALTHMTLEEDQRLAAAIPDLDLILGGHEHNNVISRDERTRIPIARAGANARFVGIHEIRFDPNTRELEISSESRPITDEIEEEPATRQEVQEWMEILREYALRARGLPEVRVRVDRHLDGREASVRYRPTALTELIASGMRRAAPGTEVAIFNSGMIRSDEVLPGGEVSSEDVLKMLPFGGRVLSVEMSGSLLQRTLDRGQANLGKGGYLQTIGIRREDAGWLVGDVALDPARRYRVALNDYLAAGLESGLEFLRPGPELQVLGEHGEITQSLLIELLYTQPGAGSMDNAED
jgi:5'-nucleotidase